MANIKSIWSLHGDYIEGQFNTTRKFFERSKLEDCFTGKSPLRKMDRWILQHWDGLAFGSAGLC